MSITNSDIDAGIAAATALAGLVGLGPQAVAAGAVFSAGKEFYGFTLQQWNAFAKVLTPEQIKAVIDANTQEYQKGVTMDLRNQPTQQR